MDKQEHKTLIDVAASVDEYLSQIDWRVNANANQGYSLGGLILNVSGKVIANYWLNHVYASEIGEAHRAGDLHIHDLDMLSGYCAGWSLRTLLTEGFNGVANKIEATPPKHLSSAVGQMVNFLGTLQNEWAGAQSFSVHPKETIVLKDKFNNIQIRRIGEFCDFFIEKNAGQQINGISIVNIKEEGFKALSFNLDGVAEWKPVTKTIRHNVTDPLHILKTNKGMLCISKNHSVFSLDKHIYVGPKSKDILGLFVVKEKINSAELKSKAAQLNIRSPIKLIEGLHSKKLISSSMVRDENGKVLFAIYCANLQNRLILKKTKELLPEKEVKTKQTDVSNVAALSDVELEQRDEIDLYQVIKETDSLRKNTVIFVDNPDQFKAQVFKNTSLRAVSLGLKKCHSYFHGILERGFVPFDIYDEYQEDYEGKFQIGKKRGEDKYPRFLRGKQLESIVKLIAWYLSEGHAMSTGVGITQFDEGFVEEIKCLLDELNAVYFINRNKNHPRKRSFIIGGYLGFFIKTLGGKYADNKQIPSFVFNVSRKNKEKFFRELIKGDGYKRNKGFAYVSTSNLLITGLNLILLDLGYRTSIKTRFEKNFEEKVVGFSNSSNNGEKLTRYDLIIHQNNDAVWPHNNFESAIIHENVQFNSKAAYEYDLSVEDNESFIGGVGLFALHNSTVDTYLAPLVRKDNLSYREVKQCIQELIYNLNVPSRWGNQTPFTNLTFDWTCPEDLREQIPYIGGEEMPFSYGDLQAEMDMINRAFIEVMTEGDAKGRIFTFPIPTYNITPDFPWDSPNTNLLFEMTARYGLPYFQNFIRSDLKPNMVRSMCCRIQLDLRELLKRGNGLFGSVEMTGSLGVVTINCARLGYLYKGDEKTLYQRLDTLLKLGKDSLEVKRQVIQQQMDNGLFPFTKRYLGTLRNHFSTLGVNGINEMIRNFTNDKQDITTEWGQAFAIRLLDHIRTRMVEFQEETGHMYNLEATPAEGTTYRFAKEDKKSYPDIIQAGTSNRPYYTNSSQLPVGFTDDPFEALELQDEIQTKYTGGTVSHLYMNERISSAQTCKTLVRRVLENYHLPYITITPTFSICPKHGYLAGEYEFCPLCDEEQITKKKESKIK